MKHNPLSLPPRLRTTAATLALAGSIACGSDATKPEPKATNTAPTVQILEGNQLDDRVPTGYSLMVEYADQDTTPDNRISSMEISIDGDLMDHANLDKPEGFESFTTPDLPEGTYTLEATVCDEAGSCAEDTRSIDIVAAHYDAQLRVFHGTRFLPATDAQLCLDDLCSNTDEQGRVRLENIGRASRAVTVNGDYHPNAMAGLATDRIDNNFFNQTPEMARNGHAPEDTQIAFGENDRTILLFADDFPFEEYANRWWLPDRENPWLAHLPPRRPHRVIFDGPAFHVDTYRDPGRSITDEQVDQLHQDMREMTRIVMDSVYLRIGFEDPRTYELTFPTTSRNEQKGSIWVMPNRDDYFFKKLWDTRSDENQKRSQTYGVDFSTDITEPFEVARWQARQSIFRFFCGIDTYDGRKEGGLTTWHTDSKTVMMEPTEEEIAMCVMGTAFGPDAIMRSSEYVAPVTQSEAGIRK